MSEFFHMGGYAPYVWSAYGVTLVVVAYNVWAAYRHHTAALSRLQQRADEVEARPEPTVRQIR